MRDANWTPVYKSYDVNASLTRFFHTFNSISDSHAPVKSINIKKKALRKANWTPVYKSYDVNESLTRFFHTFNSISNLGLIKLPDSKIPAN